MNYVRLYACFMVAVLFCLFTSHLHANSYLGHNTVAIYIFYQLENDVSFMPSIQGNDRKELIGQGIDKIFGWNDLTDAQKAFIHGVNFPDAFPLMDRIHGEMPLEILRAMYTLADRVPEVRRNESAANKEYIKKIQRYMTWGAKIHLAMDQIAHANIPDPRTNLKDHIVVEKSRDIEMRQTLFNQMGFTGDKLAKMQALAERISPFDSENYNGIDIRDEYVNLVLDFVKHGKDQKGTHVGDSINQARNSPAFVLSKIPFVNTVPKEYQGLPGITEPTLKMLSKLDPTVPPTDLEMENQVNLDDPAQTKIGRTKKGTELILNSKQ